MNHIQKIKLARKMRTPKETKNNVPIFSTTAWDRRSYMRKKRQEFLRNKYVRL